MNENLQYTGQKLTESFEGCALMPYQDVGGVWTNGYGNTKNVTPGVAITEAQAQSDLLSNIQWAVSGVQQGVTVPLTQNEFDALVDFVFNVGIAAFDGSTMRIYLNAGRYADAAEQFERWDIVGGKVVAGLLRRRIAEEDEFNGQST